MKNLPQPERPSERNLFRKCVVVLLLIFIQNQLVIFALPESNKTERIRQNFNFELDAKESWNKTSKSYSLTTVNTQAFAESNPLSEFEQAVPSSYGFPVPLSVPLLPNEMDKFTPPLLGESSGSAIAEYTRTGSPDNMITVAGPDFTATTQFRFYGQTSSINSVMIDRTVNIADNNAASIVLPTSLPKWSTYLIWAKNGNTFSKPVAVNRTDAWWIGSDKAAVGELVSVYGRNLSHDNGTSAAWIYIKPIGNANGQWVNPTSVNPYQVSFNIPSLPAATYEVWSHNGHGGNFGWSGPLTLTVISQSPFAGQSANVFNVTSYGATGNDNSDDTVAINKALTAAGNAAPATVYFPSGTYTINGVLDLKNNVSWLGSGRDTTFIKVGPTFASSVPAYHQGLIYSEWNAIDNVEFKNLTFDGNGNLDNKKIIVFRNHDYVKITNSRFNGKEAVYDGYNGSFDFAGNKYLTITDSEFIGDDLFLGNSKQVIVKNNNFRLTDFGNAAIVSWGGSEVSVTNNQAQDYDPTAANLGGVGSGRFFTTQSHPDSNRHFYIGDNTTINMSPPTNMGDANQGEQIMFEVGTSMFEAAPTNASANTVTFSNPVPVEGLEYPGQVITSRDAVIIKGRGVGQTRRVTTVNGKTITVSPDWSIVPDSTSVIGVGPAQTRSVIYHNRLDGKSNYTNYPTASVGLQMYGNVSDVVFANNILTDLRNGISAETSQVPDDRTPTPSALYFNLITNNSLNGAYIGIGGYTNFLSTNKPNTIGHLGNTYRSNSISNIVSHGIRFEPDYQGYVGGDFNQNTYEQNTITNVPIAIGVRHIFWSNSTIVNTKFSNLNLYKNKFDRGTANFNGSKAFDILGNTTTFKRAGNTWTGFQTGAIDPPLPQPAEIQSLGPSSTAAGSVPFILTVNGSGFVNGSKVKWNGQERPTTFVSASLITAQISAGDVQTAGTYPVTVYNSTTSETSNAANFNVFNCSYSLNFNSQNFASSGGTGSFAVTTNAGCARTAVSNNPSWLSVTSGSTGSGNGTINFSVAANTGSARMGTITIGGQIFTVNQAAPVLSNSTLFDFDGDRKADISVYRPEDGVWHLLRSQLGYISFQFGVSNDKLAPADYDGDGKTDIALFRENPNDPGKADFYITYSSSNSVFSTQFGSTGDIPVSRDWDGDGKSDIAVYRSGTENNPQSYFYYRPSSQPNVNYIAIPWGTTGDKPVVGDYDGDGKTDAAVFRPSDKSWYLLQSRDGFIAFQFGLSSDKLVPADYDGNGKADIAVYRNGIWYMLLNQANLRVDYFGSANDLPVPADYDGDGKTDIAVYRASDGVSYLLRSQLGFTALKFGTSTDKPVIATFLQ